MDVHSPCSPGVSHNLGVSHLPLTFESFSLGYDPVPSLLLLLMALAPRLVLLELMPGAFRSPRRSTEDEKGMMRNFARVWVGIPRR